MRPGVNGTVTATPASFAAFSIAALPPRTIRSASDTFLPNSFWIVSRLERTFASSGGLFTCQSFCGLRRMRAALAPPRLSEPRKVEADAQAVETGGETERPEPAIIAFVAAISGQAIGG